MANACVSLMNAAGVPISHAFTNPGGEALFSSLATGNYFVTAIKAGFAIGGPLGAAVVAPRTTVVQMTLAVDPNLGTGVIVGLIVSHMGSPIATARVTLKRTEELIDTHPSNAEGQVAFARLAGGTYTADATAPGFLPVSGVIVELDPDGVAQFTIELASDPAAQTGTISGHIHDEHDNPISQATVYLFRADLDVAIAFTYTNNQGQYLFCNVEPGSYFIKANKELADMIPHALAETPDR